MKFLLLFAGVIALAAIAYLFGPAALCWALVALLLVGIAGMALRAERKPYFPLAIMLALILVSPHTAFAQTSTVSAGDVYSAMLPYFASAVGAVITFLVGWVLMLAKSKLGISIDDSMRSSLQTAATNAAGLALNSLDNTLSGKTIDVKHPAIAEAVLYVVKNAPDAMAHFGLSPDQIAQKILALLPQVANTTTTAVAQT